MSTSPSPALPLACRNHTTRCTPRQSTVCGRRSTATSVPSRWSSRRWQAPTPVVMAAPSLSVARMKQTQPSCPSSRDRSRATAAEWSSWPAPAVPPRHWARLPCRCVMHRVLPHGAACSCASHRFRTSSGTLWRLSVLPMALSWSSTGCSAMAGCRTPTTTSRSQLSPHKRAVSCGDTQARTRSTTPRSTTPRSAPGAAGGAHDAGPARVARHQGRADVLAVNVREASLVP